MTKVNLDPKTPSQKIISQENVTLCKEVTDIDGKVYTLKIPDALDEFDLNAALGTQSTNFAILAQATPLIYIETIEGEAFRKPASFNEIRAAIKRIGRNGMRAISKVVFDFVAEEQAKAEENLAEVKK